jgi:predicted lactoylglutathione lyase
MTKEIWFNLPVKDVKRSKEFFANIGFTFSTKYGNTDDSAAMQIGSKNVIVMLFEESAFRKFIQANISDPKNGTEMLISFDAESREEVDQIVEKVKSAGGTVFGEPSDIQGWMYGSGFIDLDGHRWNVLYMDMSKMPR